MASDKEFLQGFLLGLTDVRLYPMMGDYVLYCRERAVGCICDNTVFVKVTPASRKMLADAPMRPPYAGAKPRFVVTSCDKEFLQELFDAVASETPAPKKKR